MKRALVAVLACCTSPLFGAAAPGGVSISSHLSAAGIKDSESFIVARVPGLVVPMTLATGAEYKQYCEDRLRDGFAAPMVRELLGLQKPLSDEKKQHLRSSKAHVGTVMMLMLPSAVEHFMTLIYLKAIGFDRADGSGGKEAVAGKDDIMRICQRLSKASKENDELLDAYKKHRETVLQNLHAPNADDLIKFVSADPDELPVVWKRQGELFKEDEERWRKKYMAVKARRLHAKLLDHTMPSVLEDKYGVRVELAPAIKKQMMMPPDAVMPSDDMSE